MKNILKNKEEYIYGDTRDCINIGYGVNDEYTRCMATSIASFCLNNKKENFTFHIVTTSLNVLNKKNIEKLAKNYKINIILYEIYNDCIVNKNTNWSIAIYYRIFLPLLIKDVKRLIYVDADIICMKEASSLFEIKLEKEQIIGAVASIKWFSDRQNLKINLPMKHKYFNSGVLIIDVLKWNEYKVFDKFIKIIEKNNILDFPDQDALNIIMLGKVKYIDKIYNYTKSEIIQMEDIILRHFASHPKPWTKSWYLLLNNEEEKNIYKKYEDCTPWINCALEEPKSYRDLLIYIKLLWENKKYFKSIYYILKFIIKILINKMR